MLIDADMSVVSLLAVSVLQLLILPSLQITSLLYSFIQISASRFPPAPPPEPVPHPHIHSRFKTSLDHVRSLKRDPHSRDCSSLPIKIKIRIDAMFTL